jgi:hypothetical protein
MGVPSGLEIAMGRDVNRVGKWPGRLTDESPQHCKEGVWLEFCFR